MAKRGKNTDLRTEVFTILGEHGAEYLKKLDGPAAYTFDEMGGANADMIAALIIHKADKTGAADQITDEEVRKIYANLIRKPVPATLPKPLMVEIRLMINRYLTLFKPK